MEKSSSWTAMEDNASSQQDVAVLDTKTRGRRAQSFAAIFALTSHLFLRRARTEQVPQAVELPMAVQTHKAGDGRVAQ